MLRLSPVTIICSQAKEEWRLEEHDTSFLQPATHKEVLLACTKLMADTWNRACPDHAADGPRLQQNVWQPAMMPHNPRSRQVTP